MRDHSKSAVRPGALPGGSRAAPSSLSSADAPDGAGPSRRGVVEEFYLAARNIEFSIESFLMENSQMLDGRTRRFLAQTRDTMGSVADRAESEIERP